MMNYDEKNNANIEELNLDAMEDVAGGGIKEIVAGVTLAAMTMTGSPVSAFGIARAMAEESNAIIEEAPAQEAYGMEYQGQADVTGPEAPVNEVTLELGGGEAPVSAAAEVSEAADPIAETAAMSQAIDMDALKLRVKAELVAHLDEGLDVATGKVYDALLETAPEQAIDQALRAVLAEMDEAGEAPEFYQALEEEAPEEVEAVLDEEGATAKPEAEETEAEAADDREALLNDLINTAMDASQEEGLYAALDNTFSTLAQNASALADPETGVIEADGDQIVSMTFDALSSRFDVEPELLMGAIGAAAARADERGDLQALGGDPALVSMAVSNDSVSASTKKALKAVYDSSLDGIALACPAFKPFVPLLKAFCGIGDQGPTNADIIDELKTLEGKIDECRRELENHTYNVVAINEVGDKYNSLKNKAGTVRTLIGDIEQNPNLTDAQKLQKTADLYNDAEFRSLMSAMNGATDCFYSASNDIFHNTNIFDAAYNTALPTVMFSGEALDVCVPYLAEQFAVYSAAYTTMSQVFDAYEQVYGAGSLTQSRQQMTQRLMGKNLDGSASGKSIPNLMADFLKRDRFVYVGRSTTTHVELNQKLFFQAAFGRECWRYGDDINPDNWHITPSIMARNPLNEWQVNSLIEYCNAKNVTVFDFLFNQVRFTPVMDMSPLQKQIDALIAEYIRASIGANDPLIGNPGQNPQLVAIQKQIDALKAEYNRLTKDNFCFKWEGDHWIPVLAGGFLLCGSQRVHNYTTGHGDESIDFKAVLATEKGKPLETFLIARCYPGQCGDIHKESQIKISYLFNVIFFQPR